MLPLQHSILIPTQSINKTLICILTGVKTLLDTDKGVKSFLETPVIDRKAKKQGIEIILGSGKSQTTSNFFGMIG